MNNRNMDNKAQQQAKQDKNSTRSSAYTLWIHCNRCYERYEKKTRIMYLLACDHVTCAQCTPNVSETHVNGPQIYKCPLCGRQTRGCKLGNEMPTHLKDLFHPKPYLDGLNTHRIMEFQEKHRRRFLEYLDRNYLIIEDHKKDIARIKDQAKKHYQESIEARLERKHLEKRVIGIKHQRKEMEEIKKTKCSNSSDVSSHSSETKKLPAISTASSGITSFSYHSRKHSFVL